MEYLSTTQIVRQVLEEDARARSNDDHLYLRVVSRLAEMSQISIDPSVVTAAQFFERRVELGLPSIERIRRIKLRVQHEFPALSGNPSMRHNDRAKAIADDLARKRSCHGVTIRCIDTGKTYPSIKAAADETGIPADAISKCCRGVQKTAGNMAWEYDVQKECATLCWSCKNALGGCSWTAYDPQFGRTRFKPVPGWVAKKTSHDYGINTDTSYHVIKCPLYVPDRK